MVKKLYVAPIISEQITYCIMDILAVSDNIVPWDKENWGEHL